MNVPQNLKYTKEHEWSEIKDGVATIGITDFAQSSLGDIVFLEIPSVGTDIAQGETFGVVESIKSVSDLYAPISGTVIARNDSAESTPEALNSSPYETWLIKVKMKNLEEEKNLMTSESYNTFCQSSH